MKTQQHQINHRIFQLRQLCCVPLDRILQLKMYECCYCRTNPTPLLDAKIDDAVDSEHLVDLHQLTTFTNKTIANAKLIQSSITVSDDSNSTATALRQRLLSVFLNEVDVSESSGQQ